MSNKKNKSDDKVVEETGKKDKFRKIIEIILLNCAIISATTSVLALIL